MLSQRRSGTILKSPTKVSDPLQRHKIKTWELRAYAWPTIFCTLLHKEPRSSFVDVYADWDVCLYISPFGSSFSSVVSREAAQIYQCPIRHRSRGNIEESGLENSSKRNMELPTTGSLRYFSESREPCWLRGRSGRETLKISKCYG